MGIIQKEFTASEEESINDIEDNELEKEERFFSSPQPITKDDHIENPIVYQI
jgi:hypothetical protein